MESIVWRARAMWPFPSRLPEAQLAFAGEPSAVDLRTHCRALSDQVALPWSPGEPLGVRPVKGLATTEPPRAGGDQQSEQPLLERPLVTRPARLPLKQLDVAAVVLPGRAPARTGGRTL